MAVWVFSAAQLRQKGQVIGSVPPLFLNSLFDPKTTFEFKAEPRYLVFYNSNIRDVVVFLQYDFK